MTVLIEDAKEFFADLGFEVESINTRQFMAWNADEVFWVGLGVEGRSTIHTRTRRFDNPMDHQVLEWDDTLDIELGRLLSALDTIDNATAFMAEA